MNALTLNEDFQISAGERDAYKVALAKAEGDLLIIAAHRRLGLNTDTDEDGFPYYVWEWLTLPGPGRAVCMRTRAGIMAVFF